MSAKIFVTIILFCSNTWVRSQFNESAFQNLRYDIVHNEVSPNGKYVSFRKAYQDSRDTLVVLNNAVRGKEFYCTDGVKRSFFTKSNTLFIAKKSELEVLRFKDRNPVRFKNVLQVEHLSEGRKILTINKGPAGNYLVVLDENGVIIKSYPDIDRIEVLADEQVYAIGKTNGNSVLFQFVDNEMRAFYSGMRDVKKVMNANDRNIIIAVGEIRGSNLDLVMVDRQSRNNYLLKNALPGNIFQVMAANFTNVGDQVYVQLALSKGQDVDKKIDIWYGNDNSLETKFYKDTQQHYVLWDPMKNRAKFLDNEEFPEIAFTGNSQFYLAFNPYHLQDYSTFDVPLEVHRYDLVNDDAAYLGKAGSSVYLNKDGSLLISKIEGSWVLYSLTTCSEEHISIPESDHVYFSTDNRFLYFEQQGGIVIYDLSKKRASHIPTIEGFESSILNNYTLKILPKYGVYKSYIDADQPLVVNISNSKTGASAVGLLENKAFTLIVPQTSDKITSIHYNVKNKVITYVSENLGSPPALFAGNGSRALPVYYSNSNDHYINKVRKQIFNYTNSEGIPISGLLIYPMNFDPAKKYPMIVNIYERQSKFRNVYLRDGYYGMTDGFNLRHYIENEYFVFLPDIIFSDKGTGFSALDCVEKGFQAISIITSIDFEKVGLIGHSHGGYETNFIATHSNRFAAFASGAGNSDLVKSYFSYNLNFNSPFYWQFEDGQYRIGKSFFEDKAIYLENSPIQNAEKVNAPVLLWAGKNDVNIDWEQTMEFFLALKRSQKKVVAIFYEDEGHSIVDPLSRFDLYSRISDWFAFHLKGVNKEWIDKLE
ncbi:alpha/beta hydrolase family protein [Chryseobacterium koreense]|uniref:Peptidase S9 prolyl oligopeptidase catalytic domain-containing protein n=1 Tax=Chryseobacterium koreense CCUG 49689 TaxID=1304281 RepID=A0A0J7LMA1_9FLAO|nr:prolyl oligopeptidase family serine peptidase [Chryseobacterium koreense]KMQ70215.1 hypothetical protein ACM44_13475 [Chryseobacterium koreense CCUG 49689]MBB5334789.1 dipeptidyl aminopeptidase/acylaminoacyl peptidase [Chryseobacterium koreense]